MGDFGQVGAERTYNMINRNRSQIGRTLLKSAVDHLEEAGLDVTEVHACPDQDAGSDAVLRITSPAGTQLYEVQLEWRLSPAVSEAALSNDGRPVLFVTQHISDKIAGVLRHRGIQYVDTAGNMYLRQAGLLLDIRGRQNPTIPKPTMQGRPLRAFKSSGLKVIFAILSSRHLVAAPYREIAEASGTSLGTVQWVFKELEDAGYISSYQRDRRVHRSYDLFEKWVDAYTFDLSPRLILARFKAPDPWWWKEADDALRAVDAQWGAETAAYHLNSHLHPGMAVIYAAEVPRRLAIEYRFQQAQDQANVEIRERFWNLGEEETNSITVPTPLIYADLIASADPRQLQAATDLRKNDAILRRFDRH